MMVGYGLSGDASVALENAKGAPGGEPFDEYRDLVMLADAWERGSLEPETSLREALQIKHLRE